MNGDELKNIYTDKVKVNNRYQEYIKNYPLSTLEIWERWDIIRDALEPKYGLLNFVNMELTIDRVYIGHFNSIVGKRGNVRRLFDKLVEYYDCFYRFDFNRPSESYIIFPINSTDEIIEVLDKL